MIELVYNLKKKFGEPNGLLGKHLTHGEKCKLYF